MFLCTNKMYSVSIPVRRFKERTYIFLIRPFVTYPTDHMTYLNTRLKKTLSYQKEILRKIFDTINNWRIRKNEEI